MIIREWVRTATARIFRKPDDALDGDLGTEALPWDNLWVENINGSPPGGGSGAVDSVFTRTGNVVAESGDYDFPKISGELATGQVAANAITFGKMQQIAGFSIPGKAATGTGDMAAITCGSGGVLRRSGSGNLEFGTLVVGNLGDNIVTHGKYQQISGFSILAKADTGTGNVAALTAGTDHVLRRSGSGNLAFGTLVTGNIGNAQVTFGKIQDIATSRLLGRTSGGSGSVEELQQLTDTLHGDRGGGSLHAVATAAVAGFMLAADKDKLDKSGVGVNTSSSADDLDNELPTSFFFRTAAAPNTPTGGAGFVLNIRNSSTIARQVFFENGNDNVYTRRRTSGGWQAWKQFQFV